MVSQRVIMALVTFAFVLPVAIVILEGVARLLGAMQDDEAAAVIGRVALAVGIAWVINLVCLVLAQGVNTLGPPSDRA